jgi:Tol biopolymer transport system component
MLTAFAVLVAAQDNSQVFAGWPDSAPATAHEKESHLANIRQLTFGGQNAEAYWNLDGTQIIFQSTQPGFPDEQIFTMNVDGSNKKLKSTGLGRTTCSYFSPDGEWIYFSSTHKKNPGPQAKSDMSQGYVWMVNPDFDLYRVRPDGTGIETVITKRGYVAETTISPDGSYMTFTGGFDGDLEIYRSDLDGNNIKRLTYDFGYDGGPFVSWDGEQIVYRRAPSFKNAEERADYLRLWKMNLVRPSRMDLWLMDSDGENKRQVTDLPGASFAPFIHPNGKQIIFCSNMDDPRGREFDLYLINTDGTGLKRITYQEDFDGFPMFSRDGKKLIFASNRNGKEHGDTNVFVADWID